MENIKKLLDSINVRYQFLSDTNPSKTYNEFIYNFDEMTKLLAKLTVELYSRTRLSKEANEAFIDYLLAVGLVFELAPLKEKLNKESLNKYRPHILLFIGVFLSYWVEKGEWI